MIADSIGHYTILRKLEAGGMGEVYLARDETLGRKIALEILPPEAAANRERLARFRREAIALGISPQLMPRKTSSPRSMTTPSSRP
jgi:serine/threonine protein kinase